MFWSNNAKATPAEQTTQSGVLSHVARPSYVNQLQQHQQQHNPNVMPGQSQLQPQPEMQALTRVWVPANAQFTHGLPQHSSQIAYGGADTHNYYQPLADLPSNN